MKEIILFIKSFTARDVIALYAAFISSIALIWNIANSITEKVPRIKIKMGVQIRFMGIPGVELEQINSIISITVVNKSIYDMYINEPFIKLPEKIDNYNRYTVTNFTKTTNYPILIKPREQYKTELELGINLVNLLKRCKNLNKKIKIEIVDTTGKKFKSNNLKIVKVLKFAENKKAKNS